jgi:hypothetical protein
MTSQPDSVDPLEAAPWTLPGPGYAVVGSVSLLLRGTLVASPDDLDPSQATFGLTLETLANPDLKSPLRDVLGGVLTGRIVARRLRNDPLARGIHQGHLEGEAFRATMLGMINAGSHRPPLYRYESFEQVGHLEGVVTGAIDHEQLGPCRVVGSYVLDTNGPPDDDLLDVTGVLEGSILAETDGLASE